jgi:hypothetical protein
MNMKEKSDHDDLDPYVTLSVCDWILSTGSYTMIKGRS